MTIDARGDRLDVGKREPVADVPPVWATPRTPSRPTFGPAVAKVAHALGTPLMPWQRMVADVGLELVPEALPELVWAYRTVLVSVQRQTGKTTLSGPIHVHRGIAWRDALSWFTAQKRQDARDTWLEIVKRLRRSPLAPPFVKIRESNGSECVSFPSGSTFRPFAPVEDALHGKANELVTVDELWAFTEEQGNALEAAIMPTFTTTGGQFFGMSAAGTSESKWMAKLVDLGRSAVGAGQRDTVAYFEWALPESARSLVERGIDRDASPAERDAAFAAVLAAHPGRGYTLREDVLAQMLTTLGPGNFLRGFGNLWTPSGERVIPAPQWAACLATDWPRPPAGTVALGFDSSPDHADGAIMAAWRAGDRMRVDVVERRAGTGWMVERILDLRTSWRPVAIGYQAGGPAGHVADELDRSGVLLAPVAGRDYAAACAAMLTGIRDVRVAHPGATALDEAVEAAAQRNAGDAWVWYRRDAASSIAALVGATVAAWSYDHRPEPIPEPLIVVAGGRR